MRFYELGGEFRRNGAPGVKYPSGSKMLAITFNVSLFVEHSVCFGPLIISRSSSH